MLYKPEFDGVVEGYAVKQIDKNLWRFLPDCTFEDLEQECYKTFLICVNWYNTKCDEDKKIAKVFMGYFKRSLHNCFVDLSHFTTRNRFAAIDPNSPSRCYKVLSDDATVWFELIQDAPEEIGNVLKIILSAPKELFEVLGLQKRGGRWSNSRFCEILGITTQIGMMAKVKEYLSENVRVEI